jgi:2-succinyl-6-hydroxy-2,4-cyclohexadiene-1-carboxylate synthase
MDRPLPYDLSQPQSDKPVLLLLHGFMGSRHDWDDLVEYFSGTYRLLTVDLPGHGEFHIDEERFITISRVAVMLAELLDELSIERVDVLGYSMGGRVALNFAVYFPHRCHRVVIVSASPGLKSARERLIRIKHDKQLADRLRRESMGPFVSDWYQQQVFSSLEHHPEIRDEMMSRRLENDPVELALALDMLGLGMMAPLGKKLANLKVPLLYIAGELDDKYSRIGRQLADLCPSVEVRIISRAGHLVHCEQPETFRSLVHDFLTRD